jgi:putative ABC transport system substrate-binding protein
MAALAVGFAPGSGPAQTGFLVKQVGVVLFGYQPDDEDVVAFRQGLRDAGYTEGRDLSVEIRPVNADLKRLDAALAELIARKVDVLMVEGTAAALAAKRATGTVPIVMAFVADPVGSGIVTNLSRPGRNITGFSNMTVDLAVKRLQLLKEAVPKARRIGVLWNPDTTWHQRAIERLQAAAPALGVELEVVAAQTRAELDPAFGAFAQAKVDALLVVDAPFTGVHGPAIMDMAMQARLPVAYARRRFVTRGALLSYAADSREMFRDAAVYVDKILKGARPGDLPIQQPTKFVLGINMKTARALGIKVPESLLLRADEVIR